MLPAGRACSLLTTENTESTEPNSFSAVSVSSVVFAWAVLVVVLVMTTHGQDRPARPVPKPTLPNPYRLDSEWPTLPATMKGPNGQKWVEVIRAHFASDGDIWGVHCGYAD